MNSPAGSGSTFSNGTKDKEPLFHVLYPVGGDFLVSAVMIVWEVNGNGRRRCPPAPDIQLLSNSLNDFCDQASASV
jgi:hypothetical protein